MSRKLENSDLGEVSEPAIIESLKCLDMNSKESEENTKIDGNNLEEKGLVTCAHCKRSNPTKRCTKRHAKCLPKLFCDLVCEKASHQKKPTVDLKENDENIEETDTISIAKKSEAAKAAQKKKKAEKKAKQKPNKGTTRCSGEFWWA